MNILIAIKSKDLNLLPSIVSMFVLFNNLNNPDCYLTTYKFYYSCFYFSNKCLDFSTDLFNYIHACAFLTLRHIHSVYYKNFSFFILFYCVTYKFPLCTYFYIQRFF